MYSAATASTLFSHQTNAQLEQDVYLNSFKYLLEHNPDRIIDFLKETKDYLMLIKLSLSDESLSHWCKDIRMIGIWNEVWRQLDENPTYMEAENNADLIYRGRLPQQHISSYQLVCGWHLYTEACELHENQLYPRDSAPVLKLLKDAASLNYFEALQALSDIYCDQLCKNLIEFPEEKFAPFVNAAPIHGTPGYLLCALNYYYIAEYYSRKQNFLKRQQSYMLSLTFLYAAQHCEFASGNEIYNAYCGQGLIGSNPWGMVNIAQSINVLIAQSQLDDISKDRAYVEGMHKGQDFVDQPKENNAHNILRLY